MGGKLTVASDIQEKYYIKHYFLLTKQQLQEFNISCQQMEAKAKNERKRFIREIGANSSYFQF